MNKFLILAIYFSLSMMFLYKPSYVFAFEEKDTFPKTANYYLQPHVRPDHYDDLSKYDLLVLDADVNSINPDLVPGIKLENDKVQVFMYVPSQSVNIQDLNSWAQFRRETYSMADTNDWWLRDSGGNFISFNSVWPTIRFVDIGGGWESYLPEVVGREVENEKIWDGVFYDMVFANLSWLNNGDIDINKDGKKDSIEKVNSYWQKSVDELMKNTKEKVKDAPVVVNIDIPDKCTESVNGTMMENFPAKWMGDRSWEYLVDQYLNYLPEKNEKPQVYVINSNTENTGVMDNYRKMRFGLTTTLLGDGYFSFDYGDTDHSQVWWYDEYETFLGKAESRAYNLLANGGLEVKKGLWRRNFENGIVLVNSTDKAQEYIFNKEKFEKINGEQDRRMNNGTIINWVRLESNDGVVLLKINNEIKDDSYNNGSFVRVFNKNGESLQNGFFTYKDGYAGNTQILISDIDSDSENEVLVNGSGKISVYKKGKIFSSFMPYNGKFLGEVSFSVSDLNNDGTKEIITGAGSGGGPHVRIFNIYGKSLTGGFFAYDKNFRGGVDVAVIDLNGDGVKEIITGAGQGGGPHVRVFTKDGESLTGGFFAYDKNFRGGVSIAVGDTDKDGEKEIITGPGKGGGPHVKIFSKDGLLENDFFAFDKNSKSGIEVISDDINKDGVFEVLVSTIDF